MVVLDSSGYCRIGSLNPACAPISKMSRLTTLASTGRLMKISVKDMAATASAAPAGGWVLSYDGELEALRMLVDGRPTDESAGPDRQPAATAARRLRPVRPRRTSPPYRPRRSSQPSSTGPRREDPPPARRRTTDRADCGGEEDQSADHGNQGDGQCSGLHADGAVWCGPVVAARILADVGDVARFADRTGSRPGPGPHRWTPPRASRPATGCRGPVTAR